MSKSLKEQLLAAGLVKPKQVTEVNQQKRKQARQQPKAKAAPPTPAQQEAQKAAAEKAARDKELNRQRQAERERRAIINQLEQIIEAQRLSTKDGETPFRFVVKSKIKKIYVTAEQHAALVKGSLGVVRYKEAFAVVTRETAERIAERDARTVLVLRDGTEPDIQEDPDYADYKVPDDLMW
ncbi:MAG: DUF2058 domain-containing protein [Gammaproteobacteria bacterium]